MGDGMAIIPESETLYAPVDAEIAVLMPESRHACGLKLQNGMEVLLHIGIDTVGMNGDGFEYLVQEGQKVHAGTPLVRFDRARLKRQATPMSPYVLLRRKETHTIFSSIQECLSRKTRR